MSKARNGQPSEELETRTLCASNADVFMDSGVVFEKNFCSSCDWAFRLRAHTICGCQMNFEQQQPMAGLLDTVIVIDAYPAKKRH